MNTGRFILSQVLDLVHRQTLDRIVKRYETSATYRHFGYRQQLTCMVFAQMTAREGLRDIATCLTRWVEDTYHTREHSTLGMRPLDRFGLNLGRIRHLHHCDFNEELFHLETTRKVRIDNTFNFQKVRYEAPRDLRSQTITLRYSRFTGGSHPIGYFDGERLGQCLPIDYVHNDRKPNLGQDNF